MTYLEDQGHGIHHQQFCWLSWEVAFNFFNELALDSQSMAWCIVRLTTTQKVYWVGTMKTHVSVKIIFRKWWPITNKWRTMTKISQLLVLDRILYRRRGQRWGWQGAQGRRWWESEQCSIFLRFLPHSLPPGQHLLLLLRQPAQKSKLTRVQGYLLKPGYQVTATFFIFFRQIFWPEKMALPIFPRLV